MLDPSTSRCWFEVAQVPIFDINGIDDANDTRDKSALDKSSGRISQLFNQVWLSRYPRPIKVVIDNGSEFKKSLVPFFKDFSNKPTATTIKNPQSNAMVECIHQVIEIKTQQLEDQVLDYVNPFGDVLASIASIVWAICSSLHRRLEATPVQLVFGHDMIFNIKTVVNWDLIHKQKQSQVDFDNSGENKCHVVYYYKVVQKVYLNYTYNKHMSSSS
jgi:hypothetical protein